MSELNNQIQDMQNELLVAKEEKKITPEGTRLLDALQNGQWATGGFGQFLKGMTLNFSDEAIGAVKSLVSKEPAMIAKTIGRMTPGQPAPTPYQVGTALERVGQEQYQSENPVSSMGLQALGGMMPSLLTKRPTPQGMLAQMPMAGVTGATAALGESENPMLSPETGQQMAVGGATGIAAVPVAKAIGYVAGKGYRSLVDSMFNNPQRLGVDQSRALIRDALNSDVGGFDEAIKYVLDKGGKPYTLADIGPNSRAFLDAANLLPGPGKKTAQAFLEERDKGMLKRLTTDMQVAFGTGAAYFDEFNALKEARSAMGQKLYGAALPRPVEMTPEFTTLLERPSMQQAYGRAVALAKEQGIKLPQVHIGEDGKLLDPSNNPITKIDTTFLHYMKMGLDDLIYTGKSPSSGMGNTSLNAIKDTRSQFIGLIDDSNKAYKAARNYWANDTAVLDAMQEGRSAFSKKPIDLDILINDVKSMSKSEKDALRLGVMQSVLDRLGGAQTENTIVSAIGNPALNILKNQKNLRLIKETFPTDQAGQDSYQKFIGNLLDEVEMKTTSKTVLQGAQTAGRQEAISAIREGAKKELPIMSGTQFILRALQRDFSSMGDEQLKATANEISRILTTTDPKKLQIIAKELAGSDISTVLRKQAPEALPILGRALLGPYSIGSMAGRASPYMNNAIGGLFTGQ